MNALVDLIIAAGTKATENEEFDDAGTVDGKTSVTFYDSFLLKNAPGHAPKKEHPFVLVRPVGGEDTAKESILMVPIQCGIHTHGNVDEGVHDIRRLVALLLSGCAEAEQFYPYSLDRIITTLGDPEDGNQAHPKYYANMELTFSRQPVLDTER